MYKKFIDTSPELFFVAYDDNFDIVGFCMGYYMENSFLYQEFIHENRGFIIFTSLLSLIRGNKYVWGKIFKFISEKINKSNWEIVTNKYDKLNNNEIGDLLSICVLPKYQGQGYSQQLMTSFLAAISKSGRKLCMLSVKCDNLVARRFYERNGFEVFRTRDSEGITYAKQLNLNGN